MNHLQLIRYERGLTRGAVAQGSGVAERTLGYLESDAAPRPSAPTAKALADFYKVSVPEILGIDEPKAAA